ncbi:hypothetical protein PH5382_03519 [Phaeobacter sp. CECT 5382]|nr:hypothetical protein PH5382_03519 [Phaeobacter sp. CECT 5382]
MLRRVNLPKQMHKLVIAPAALLLYMGAINGPARKPSAVQGPFSLV